MLCSIRGPLTGYYPIQKATPRVQNIHSHVSPIKTVNSVSYSTFSAQNEANLKINTVTAVVALVLVVAAVFQQDRKCGYNVTIKRVGETIVAVAMQYYVE